jgi:nitrogen fixation/metabolism regulation signal transduction histidine kinase
MTLRRKFVAYLVALHLLFAAGAVVFLLDHRIWLLVVEILFAASLAVTLALVSALFRPLDLIRSGAATIEERDFATRFREVGPPEVVELYAVYNRMVDHLREERIQLEEQNWFLARILDASPSGILIFDFNARIVSVNPAAERLLETPAARLIGCTLADLPVLGRNGDDARGSRGEPGADSEPGIATELMGLDIDQPRVIPLHGRRRVKCQRSQFLDRGFSRSFILLEELTEELRQSEKSAYEKLIRMMSHEINNTSAAVCSLLESCCNYEAQIQERDRQDFTGALAVAIARMRQLSAFMRDLADVVRLPAPKLKPGDLPRLVGDVQFLCKEESARRRITWVTDIERGLPPVALDPIQMEQVLLNILKNAMEAIGEDGTIAIRLTRDPDGRCRAMFRDSGRGVPVELREHLFTPFFTSKENGQGIGLTVVREILLAHGCDFALESRPGGPTEFSIRFPIPAALPSAPPVEAAPNAI